MDWLRVAVATSESHFPVCLREEILNNWWRLAVVTWHFYFCFCATKNRGGQSRLLLSCLFDGSASYSTTFVRSRLTAFRFLRHDFLFAWFQFFQLLILDWDTFFRLTSCLMHLVNDNSQTRQITDLLMWDLLICAWSLKTATIDWSWLRINWLCFLGWNRCVFF